MLIRNSGDTRPHVLPHTPRRVCILSVTAVPTWLQLPSRSQRVHCHTHTPPPSTMCNAVLPCRICYVVLHRAEAWNLLQRMTKVSNRHCYVDRWRMFHANFMHYTESDDQKLGGGGPIHCWSPQPKSWGTCLPRSPWLLRLCLRSMQNVAKFQENLTLQEFKVVQGHQSWCQWKTHMWLPISH